ncbi:MAG TPA: GNAT family N-acetyltransferase [Microbacteriaceae bacterium]|jgi:putative acetyltransferase|nr:GNAT family N-acetyltransferase [Microbacteriaceae bacterium]HQX34968.1 GNAT family N-acetyltransferase [Microbacteriaceae bacterium]HQZ47874.1 GNAT family N-acetyltransferase [Microbacteriaceae bacterium]HRA08911.1 GNAT family N-acetyltransferase [Microbacteriaceae bacterium]
MHARPSSVARIRPYAADDAEATLAVFVAAITVTAAPDYSEAQVLAWARPEDRDTVTWHAAMMRRNSFVAEVDGNVVGFSDVQSDGYIDMMFVSPEHARQGVAGALLREAQERAAALGATRLWANVSVTARPFFEAHGFTLEQVQYPSIGGVVLRNFRMSRARA